MDIYMFLKGLKPDDRNRMLHEIWEYKDRDIETSHDFIQKMFPIDAPSHHSLNKFYLGDPQLIDQIRMDPTAIKNLLLSRDWFLGFLQRNDAWQYFYNHNQLRITRIIKCLKLLVSHAEAQKFYDDVIFLKKKDSKIPASSNQYWIEALNDIHYARPTL